MSFIVEDGSGKSDANSYGAIVTVDAYLADYGNDADWLAATDSAKEEAIRIIQRQTELQALPGEEYNYNNKKGWNTQRIQYIWCCSINSP